MPGLGMSGAGAAASACAGLGRRGVTERYRTADSSPPLMTMAAAAKNTSRMPEHVAEHPGQGHRRDACAGHRRLQGGHHPAARGIRDVGLHDRHDRRLERA